MGGREVTDFARNLAWALYFAPWCPQTLIKIGPKRHALGVDHRVDHGPKLASMSSYQGSKKARCCGLFCWSECTDLNRGPLVPQVVRKPFSWVGSGLQNGLVVGFSRWPVRLSSCQIGEFLARLETTRRQRPWFNSRAISSGFLLQGSRSLEGRFEPGGRGRLPGQVVVGMWQLLSGR